MATITVSDNPRSLTAKIVIMFNANEGMELELPKQVADLITPANSLLITSRLNADRVIGGA